MSMRISPPNTYSRLFRPWDVKKNQDSTEDLNETVSDNEVKCENSERVPYINYDQFNFQQSPILPIMDYTSEAFYYQNCMDVKPVPFMGINPVSIRLMEQEYTRVLAEEAHAKMLSSRKQRPKKFKCEHCDAAFSNNGQLKGHIRIHTGERPFKCDDKTCGKTFTRNEELTRHRRIHTGVKPFSCNVCGKKFGRKDHLKKHSKTHYVQEQYVTPFLPMYPYLYEY